MTASISATISTYHHFFGRSDSIDWEMWRYCYEGGTEFRQQYLKQLPEKEDAQEFTRRLDITPIPSFAKREVRRVINALFRRFTDISRRNGTDRQRRAFSGNGRGMDNRGSTMNAFLGRKILPELLVMGKVGILIDAPELPEGLSKADEPKGFQPYLTVIRREQMKSLTWSSADEPSDFTKLEIWQDEEIQDQAGALTVTRVLSKYELVDGRVIVERSMVTDKGVEEQLSVRTLGPGVTEIPFVLLDIGDSLIKDACSHQIALLNLISSDTNYSVDSNFSFLTRQRIKQVPGHLAHRDNASVGRQKGLFYEKGEDRPGFISPPTGPLKASLELRKELKTEIEQLVTGAIEDIGPEGTVESGLAFIGLEIQNGENRIWHHYSAFEEVDPDRREVPDVSYPTTWSLKTFPQRIEEADALLSFLEKIPNGVKGRKTIAKLAQSSLLHGVVSYDELTELEDEINNAPYTTANPDVVLRAKEAGVFSTETAALALGALPGEAEKAKQDHADRAAMIAKAQSDAAGSRGVPDLSVQSESKILEKEGGKDKSLELGGDDEKGVRGDGDRSD